MSTPPAGRPRAPVHRHRPRRHRRARPRRGHRVLRDHLRHAPGARGDQRGAGRPRGDDGRRRLRLLPPAARAAVAGVDDREVPRPLRARASSSWPTGSPTSRRSARSCASAACACCTTSRGAARRTRGSTSSTPRTPAGVLVELVEPASSLSTSHGVRHDRLPISNLRRNAPPTPGAHVQHILDAILAGDTSAGGLRRPRPARVLPRRDRAQGRGRHVRGGRRPATRTRASRCTSRTSRCPSSARARRWSR